MAIINEGEDVIETGEEVVANVKQFLQSGCACSKGPKSGPCSRQFSEDSVVANLNNCLELTHGELDLVILANIQALTTIEIVGEKRKRCLRSSFSFQSKTICKDMFLNLYGSQVSRMMISSCYLQVKRKCPCGASTRKCVRKQKSNPSATLNLSTCGSSFTHLSLLRSLCPICV